MVTVEIDVVKASIWCIIKRKKRYSQVSVYFMHRGKFGTRKF